MTLLVGVEGGDHYSLYADSLVTWGSEKKWYNQKVRKITDSCYIGLAGDIGPFTGYRFATFRNSPREYTSDWMYKHIARPLIMEVNHLYGSSSDWDCTMLAVTCDGMFEIDSDGSVFKTESMITAIGSGSEFAMGFYNGQSSLIPDSRVVHYLYSVTSEHINGVGTCGYEHIVLKRRKGIRDEIQSNKR